METACHINFQAVNNRKDKRSPERIRTSYTQLKFIIKPNIKIIEIREIIFKCALNF